MTESEPERTTADIQATLTSRFDYSRESILRVSLVGKGSERAQNRLQNRKPKNAARDVHASTQRNGFGD
jgi:hypothetical protein